MATAGLRTDRGERASRCRLIATLAFVAALWVAVLTALPTTAFAQAAGAYSYDDVYDLTEDRAIVVNAPGVMINDAYSTEETYEMVLVEDVRHGSVSIVSDGSFVYQPEHNFHGTDSFVYRLSGPSGPGHPATVTLRVKGVNDAPLALEDSVDVDEDGSVEIDILANDFDRDENKLNPASIKISEQLGLGTVAVNADGTVDYAPKPNVNGIDLFTYEVCDDGSPVLCDTAQVSVDIKAINDAPVAADDHVGGDEDTPLDIQQTELLYNDEDGDPEDQHLAITGVSGAQHGTVALDGNGTVTFTPAENYNGETASFDYVVSDGNSTDTAKVGVTVRTADDAPVAADDTADMQEDGSVHVDVISNDTDPDNGQSSLDLASLKVSAQASHGTATVNNYGGMTYTPNANFNGSDGFSYEICDRDSAEALCDTATVSVTVAAVNDAPVANSDSARVNEDRLVNIAVLANDTDPDGTGDINPASVRVSNLPSNGTATANANGTITYKPKANFNGSDSFRYFMCDSGGSGGFPMCAVSFVSVAVAPVAEPQCSDGRDNDRDGKRDMRDPGCKNKLDNSEKSR